MGLFGFGKKAPSRDEIIAAAATDVGQTAAEEKKEDFSSGNAKLDIEFTKIKGRLDGMEEIRKATGERFTRTAEQIGELRGMVMDTNKMISKIEVSSTKAVDLVESVHPEKLMIEVRKQDGKIEGLRAQIESSEAIMKDLMLEMKKMRDRMNFYKGVEQVIALNEEVKGELAMMKRLEATIGSHADKVETVFLEVEKKFGEFEKFNDSVKDLDKGLKKVQSDFDKIRMKVETKLDRKDFFDLLDKFNDFEKHTTNLLKLLDERNKTVKSELDGQFAKLELDYRKKLDGMKPPKESAVKNATGSTAAVDAKAAQELAAIEAKRAAAAADDTAGADVAGGDVKPGLGSKLKGFLFRPDKEDAPAQPDVFAPAPESPAAPVAQPTSAPPKKDG